MKRSLVFLLLLLPVLSMAQKTDFSGKWELNLRKTDFKQAPEWLVPRSLEVKQKTDAIIIQARIYDKEMVGHYYTETLSFDGTTRQTATYGSNKRTVSLKWEYGDKSFVLSVHAVTDGADAGSDFTETWSLENDGKTLVLDRVATQYGDYSIKAYYEKK